MKKTILLGISCLVGAYAVACSSTSGGGTQGTSSGSGGQSASSSSSSSSSGTTTTSRSSSSSSSSSGTTSSSSSSSSSSSGGTTVNGCDPTQAVDMTSMTAVTINFGGTVGLKYDHPCIKVASGTMVTFAGSFSTHPLAGGDSPPTVDSTSPIKETKTGSTATFTLSTAGTYGYFCEVHFGSGMEGAIVVQ